MDKATHLLTLCKRHCALRRGDLCLIPYIINLLVQLNLLLGMSRSPKIIPRDDALGGLPVTRFNRGDGILNGKGRDPHEFSRDFTHTNVEQGLGFSAPTVP